MSQTTPPPLPRQTQITVGRPSPLEKFVDPRMVEHIKWVNSFLEYDFLVLIDKKLSEHDLWWKNRIELRDRGNQKRGLTN